MTDVPVPPNWRSVPVRPQPPLLRSSNAEAARATAAGLGTINVALLVLNLIGTVVVSVVTLLVGFVPAVLATVLTWCFIEWLQHVLRLLAELVERTTP